MKTIEQIISNRAIPPTVAEIYFSLHQKQHVTRGDLQPIVNELIMLRRTGVVESSINENGVTQYRLAAEAPAAAANAVPEPATPAVDDAPAERGSSDSDPSTAATPVVYLDPSDGLHRALLAVLAACRRPEITQREQKLAVLERLATVTNDDIAGLLLSIRDDLL